MGYVNDNLLPNEKVLFTATIHPAVFLPALVPFLGTVCLVISAAGTPQGRATSGTSTGLLLCVSGLFFVVAIVYWLQALILVLTTEFAVTDKRVIAKTGFLRRRTLEMLLTKIESVAVRQNVLGRLLDFGTVTVVGTGGTREPFQAIRSPLTLRTEINQIIEDHA